jgi:hypothetical protein
MSEGRTPGVYTGVNVNERRSRQLRSIHGHGDDSQRLEHRIPEKAAENMKRSVGRVHQA